MPKPRSLNHMMTSPCPLCHCCGEKRHDGGIPCVSCETTRREALEEAVKVIHAYATAYPEDIFIPPPPGEHGQTVDACSARALRVILPNIERDVAALKQEAHDA